MLEVSSQSSLKVFSLFTFVTLANGIFAILSNPGMVLRGGNCGIFALLGGNLVLANFQDQTYFPSRSVRYLMVVFWMILEVFLHLWIPMEQNSDALVLDFLLGYLLSLFLFSKNV